MNKYEITKIIEDFAPPETQEGWDCSGWIVETKRKDIHNIMLALTVTDDVVNQAKENNCEMIISHHPLFSVPVKYKGTDIYCAHTNMDKANGGTTDTLIKQFFDNIKIEKCGDFLRIVYIDISLPDLIKKLKQISPDLRYTNNQNIEKITKNGFCAGSGSEFIKEAEELGCNAFVTGDVKFHTALESKIAVFDIGHFESEIFVLKVFENLVGNSVKVKYAKETSPFQQI